MLEQIELKNFKKHSHLKVAFPKGVSSIVGQNAAGKSSLLKGILLALFGVAAAGAKDNLWKWGADGEKSVGLQMHLPDWGRVTIVRTPSTAKITTEDGRTLAAGHTAVTKFIEESLGMMAKDLRTLCYSPQGETQGLLTMGPTAIQQKVEGLAKVDVIDKVLDMASKDITKLSGKLEAYPRDLDVNQISKDLESANVALDFEKMELESVLRLKPSILAADEQAMQAYRDAQTTENQKELLDRTLRELGKEQEDLTKTVKALNDQQTALGKVLTETELGDLSDTIVTLAEKGNGLYQGIKEAEKLQKDIAQLSAEVSELKPAVELHNAVFPEVAKIQTELQEQEENTQRAEYEVTSLNTNLLALTRLLKDATCPTCKQDIQGVDKADIQKRLDECSAKLAVAKTRFEEYQTLSTDLKRKLVSESAKLNYQAEANLQIKSAQLSEWQALPTLDIKEVTQEFETLKLTLANKRTQHKEEFTKITSSKSLLDQLSFTEGRRQEVLEKFLYTSEDRKKLPDADLVALQRDAMYKGSAYNDLLDRERVIKANIQIAQAKAESLVVEYAKAQKQQLEFAKLSTEKSETESLQKYLRTNRNRISGDIWSGLLNLSSALISNTTEGVLSNLSRSTSGDFTIEEEGRTVPVTESSGAQRSIIGTALRAAMTKIFYGDDLWLLLDEVTSDASDETAAAITGMLSSLNLQVVTVSHRTGESVNAGNIVEIV